MSTPGSIPIGAQSVTGRPPFDLMTVMSAAAIGCGFVIVDTRGRVLQVSESACALFGVDAPGVVGERFETVIKLLPEPGAPVAGADSPVAWVLRTARPRPAQVFRVQRKDRRVRWAQVGIAPLTAADGGPGGAVCTCVDITELVRARDALSRERQGVTRAAERFRALMDGMTDAMLVHVDGRVGYVNRALLTLLGAPAVEDVIGREVRRLLPDHALAMGPGLRQERWTLPGGKHVVVEVSERLIDLDGAPATMVLARDVTERLGTQARLVDADRLATLGTLAAGIIHEINNPLAVVLTNVQWALAVLQGTYTTDEHAGGRDAQLVAGLVDAMAGIDLVRAISRDLKSFARNDEGDRRGVDVRQVVAAALTLTRADLARRAQVVVEMPDEPLRVTGNESRLAQVFINLILNAGQAMDPASRGTNVLRVSARHEGTSVVAEVADTGAGIDDATLARIFEPFFTTKAPGEGTGLGLWICSDIVRAHGGAIAVSSEIGRGTRFRLTFPTA